MRSSAAPRAGKVRTMPGAGLPGPGGFTMIETLAVLAVLAVLLTATIGITTSISSSRGMTGVHLIASACDSARARALKEQKVVFLAFASEMAESGATGQAMIMCWLDPESQPRPQPGVEPMTPGEELAALIDGVQSGPLVPCSEWIHLPEGHAFGAMGPADASAGRNLLKLNRNRLQVRLPGGIATGLLPCLGFGSLGEVVYPGLDADSSGQLLIAIADNADPESHRPETCRWIGIQRHSGTTMILP